MTDGRSPSAILQDIADHHTGIAACCVQLAAVLNRDGVLDDQGVFGREATLDTEGMLDTERALDREVASVSTSTTPRSPAGGDAPPLIFSHHFPPHSLRGHAERALLEEGGPLELHEWADRIRVQGFDHPWNPKNPQQLEASLSALPSQTQVFVRVARGTFDLRHR